MIELVTEEKFLERDKVLASFDLASGQRNFLRSDAGNLAPRLATLPTLSILYH